MNMKVLFPTLAAAALATGSASGALIVEGTVIGVDFGGGSDNNFNDVTANGTLATVIDTTGATLTDSDFNNITFSTAGGLFNGQADGSQAGQPSIFTAANLTDWVLNNGAGFTLTFANLDDTLTYDLLIGSANGSATTVSTTYTVDGQSLTNDAESTTGGTFVTFTGLSTDGSGNLVITAVKADGNAFASASALALTAVPEPGSLALLGLGGLLIGARRRR